MLPAKTIQIIATMEVDRSLEIAVGQTFKSFSDFKQLLKKREEKLFERFVIGQGSDLVSYANQRLKGLKYADCLVYRKVTFRCKHEGDFKSRGTSKQSTSMKKGCPVKYSLSADKKHNHLIVNSVCSDHNHELFHQCVYPDDRAFTDAEAANIKRLLDFGAAVPKIIDYVQTTYGKNVKAKDIHNFRQKAKLVAAEGLSEEEQVMQILQEMVDEDQGRFSITTDRETGCLLSIFVQTVRTKGRPKGQGRTGRFAKKRKLPLKTCWRECCCQCPCCWRECCCQCPCCWRECCCRCPCCWRECCQFPCCWRECCCRCPCCWRVLLPMSLLLERVLLSMSLLLERVLLSMSLLLERVLLLVSSLSLCEQKVSQRVEVALAG